MDIEKRCKKLEEMLAQNEKESNVELKKLKQEEALLQDRLEIESQEQAGRIVSAFCWIARIVFKERQAALEKQLEEFAKAKNQELELASAQLEELREELTSIVLFFLYSTRWPNIEVRKLSKKKCIR